MYLQLTDECTMHCAHCAMSAVPVGRGRYMSHQNAIKAIDLCPKMDFISGICLGGGEPTLHPQLLNIVHHVVSTDRYVGITTNGTNTEVSLELLRLAQQYHRQIRVILSRTQYHDPRLVSQSVVSAFVVAIQDAYPPPDNIYIAGDIKRLLPFGRARTVLGAEKITGTCRARDLFIYPDGRVTRCGCPCSSKIGNIQDIAELPSQRSGYCDFGYTSE